VGGRGRRKWREEGEAVADGEGGEAGGREWRGRGRQGRRRRGRGGERVKERDWLAF
jgi:hypothetical protein